MELQLKPYYLSAKVALEYIAKKFNIKIEVDEKDFNLHFMLYDRNNTHYTVNMKNFFLSLGLVLEDIHFHKPEDLLSEVMPILLLTSEMKWMVCVGVGNGLRLINSQGDLCEVRIPQARLESLFAFSLRPLHHVVESIQVANILKNALSFNKIFYSKYFISSFFMALFALTIPVFNNLYYDKLVPSASISSLLGLLVMVILFVVFEFTLRSAKDVYQSITARKSDVDIDISFLEAVIYNKKRSGRSMSAAFVLWNEFQKAKPVLLNTLFQRVADIPIFFVFVLIIYINLGWVVVVPVFMFLFAILISFLNYYYTDVLLNKQKEVLKNRNVFITEILYSIKMIHTLNNQSLLLDWVNSSEEQSYLNLRIRKLNILYQSALAALSSLTQITVMVLAFFMVIKGEITTGAIISSAIVSGRLSGIISNIASTVMAVLSSAKTARDLTAFFETDEPESLPALQSITCCRGDINVMGVSYQYDPQSPIVINNMSLEIPAGQRVVIIGDCGAGKSSLLSLLSGYITPSEGVILYDGYNLSHLSQSFFSQQVSMVTAQDVLFTGTIESNFALKARGERERVLQALKLTNCHFVLQHPMGLRFPVNFMAKNLSSGQQQQLLISRSLCSNASVFLWDEPTSNIDEMTEKRIFDHLGHFISGKTVLMVTHRRYLIKYFDRVLVLKNGNIIRDCAPEKLLG